MPWNADYKKVAIYHMLREPASLSY